MRGRVHAPLRCVNCFVCLDIFEPGAKGPGGRARPVEEERMTVLQPVFLEEADTPSFVAQLEILRTLTPDLTRWLPPIRVGEPVPSEAGAVVVPDMTGVAYRRLAEFQRIEVPILVVTSEFGTVSMWDWEIIDFLRRRGVSTIAPTSSAEYRDVL